MQAPETIDLSRALVLLDDRGRRQHARDRCRQALEAARKLRERLEAFEREDRPAFNQWLAGEFGPLLSAARELEIQIQAKQQLVHEVEEEMLRSICDPLTAFRRVHFRRENPEAAAEEDRRRIKALAREHTVRSEAEKHRLFKNWLRENFGIDPETMGETTFRITFENFRGHLFDEEIFSFAAPAPPSPRLKMLYRLLVSRLHPDRRDDGTAAGSPLWHEVQEAYAARDLARLETLLAYCEIETGELETPTSFFQLRAVRQELRRTLRALRFSLRQAGGDHAWNFLQSEKSEPFRERMRDHLEAELAGRRRTFDYLERTLAQFGAALPETSAQDS